MRKERFAAGVARKRKTRRVALLVQTTSEWHRQLLRGVADYAREFGPWDFHIEPRGLLETMQLPKGWRGDGVILRLVDRAQERALRRRGLRHPTALLVWNGEVGREVIAACSANGLPVPDDLAVLCAEHDSVMNSLAPVPMSNIDQSPLRVGREAAALLDRLMSGRRARARPIHVPPVGVVQRQSTDTAAVDDPLVAAALRHIRACTHEPLKVSDLQKALFVSRRTLEHRFTQALGRTPAVEIRRARLEHVRRLLIETDYPLAAIAERTGYQHQEVMVRAFQRQFGLPPGRFRREQVSSC